MRILSRFSRRRVSLVISALCLSGIGVGAVLAGGSATAAAASSTPVKIGFVNFADSVPYAIAVQNGVIAAAKKHGIKVVTCDSNLSVTQAISCVQSFKSQQVQGIADYQYDQKAAPRVCAAGPKVPVVSVDIEQPPCGKVYVGSNNIADGKVGGVMLGKFAKQKFNCSVDAVLSINTPDNPGVLQREDGEIAGYKSVCPGAKITKVQPPQPTTDASISPMTDTLSRFPGATKIMILAINDDVGVGAVKAAQSAGRLGDIYIVGQGAASEVYPYVCKTTPFKNWIGDADYHPEAYGTKIISNMIKLLHHQKVPKFDYVKGGPLTFANIKQIVGPKACK